MCADSLQIVTRQGTKKFQQISLLLDREGDRVVHWVVTPVELQPNGGFEGCHATIVHIGRGEGDVA